MENKPRTIMPTQSLGPLAGAGSPADIPEVMDDRCRKISAADVRRRLDHEDIQRIACVPGVCRFCGRTMPLEYVHIAGFGDLPVLQCNRVANLWPASEAIRIERIRRAAAEKAEAAAAAKPATPARTTYWEK